MSFSVRSTKKWSIGLPDIPGVHWILYIYIIFIILFIHMYILDLYRLYILKKKNDIYIYVYVM
jgi:hypothetical protein